MSQRTVCGDCRVVREELRAGMSQCIIGSLDCSMSGSHGFLGISGPQLSSQLDQIDFQSLLIAGFRNDKIRDGSPRLVQCISVYSGEGSQLFKILKGFESLLCSLSSREPALFWGCHALVHWGWGDDDRDDGHHDRSEYNEFHYSNRLVKGIF